MPEFFFDHSWIGFNSILDVYRRGTLHLMSGVCALVTKAEFEYWGIDELLLGEFFIPKTVFEMKYVHLFPLMMPFIVAKIPTTSG